MSDDDKKKKKKSGLTIKTNVASLSAQKNLKRSNEELNQSLAKLSSGLKVRSEDTVEEAKDKPPAPPERVVLGYDRRGRLVFERGDTVLAEEDDPPRSSGIIITN